MSCRRHFQFVRWQTQWRLFGDLVTWLTILALAVALYVTGRNRSNYRLTNLSFHYNNSRCRFNSRRVCGLHRLLRRE